MSPSSVLQDGVAPFESPRPNQRRHSRYPIRFHLRYKLNEGSVNRTGSGSTLNISSGGVFFETSHPLPDHGQIDLAIKWPFSLDGGCPLILLVHGQIVRTDAKGSAVKVSRYEFHTSKRSAT